MTAAVLEPVTESTETDVLSDRIRIPLSLSDRCDGPGLLKWYQNRVPFCGAQAYVRVQLEHGELYFCAHHYNAYEATFLAAGYLVHDERDQLATQERTDR